MSNNTTLNVGSGGDVILTEDLGGFKIQVVKRAYGIAGAASDATLLYHAVAAATNNAASIKTTPGQLFSVHVFNMAAYPVYVKLYNKVSAPSPIVDPPKLTIGVQAGTQRDVTFAPADFPTGIGIAMVKGISDTDNTALALSDCVVDVEYV